MTDPGSSDEDWQLASIKQRPSRLNAKPIGSVVKRLLQQKGYSQTQAQSTLLEHWQAVVGEPLASHSLPGNVRRGVLTIFVENSTLVQELAFQKAALLKELQRRLPEMKIQDLRTRVGPVR